MGTTFYFRMAYKCERSIVFWFFKADYIEHAIGGLIERLGADRHTYRYSMPEKSLCYPPISLHTISVYGRPEISEYPRTYGIFFFPFLTPVPLFFIVASNTSASLFVWPHPSLDGR